MFYDIVTVPAAAAFRTALNLTDKQYVCVRKLGKRCVPPLPKVQSWVKIVVEDSEWSDWTSSGVHMVAWQRPDRAFNKYN